MVRRGGCPIPNGVVDHRVFSVRIGAQNSACLQYDKRCISSTIPLTTKKGSDTRITAKPTVSVTALSSFKWCEYQAYYSMHDGYPSKRPRKELVLPGLKLHNELSNLCLPNQPPDIQSTSATDMYIQRLINGIYSLQVLLRTGVTRELYVFGLVKAADLRDIKTQSTAEDNDMPVVIEGFIDQLVLSKADKTSRCAAVSDSLLIANSIDTNTGEPKTFNNWTGIWDSGKDTRFQIIDSKLIVKKPAGGQSPQSLIPTKEYAASYVLQLQIYKYLFDQLATGNVNYGRFIKSFAHWYKGAANYTRPSGIVTTSQHKLNATPSKARYRKNPWNEVQLETSINAFQEQNWHYTLDSLRKVDTITKNIDLDNYDSRCDSKNVVTLSDLFKIYIELFRLCDGRISNDSLLIKYYNSNLNGGSLTENGTSVAVNPALMEFLTSLDTKDVNRQDDYKLHKFNRENAYIGNLEINFEDNVLRQYMGRYLSVLDGGIEEDKLEGPDASNEALKCGSCSYFYICDWRKKWGNHSIKCRA